MTTPHFYTAKVHTCFACGQLSPVEIPRPVEPLIRDIVWHRLYCRWYDAREAGHSVRAALWGWAADRVVGFL